MSSMKAFVVKFFQRVYCARTLRHEFVTKKPKMIVCLMIFSIQIFSMALNGGINRNYVPLNKCRKIICLANVPRAMVTFSEFTLALAVGSIQIIHKCINV